MAEDRIALFIDVDNVLILAQDSGLPFNLSLIIDRVRQQGKIMSSKAYADWSSAYLRPVLGDFRANAIELVQLPTSAATVRNEHKNTADIQLAVDALEMVFSTVPPNSVVIVGGDRDFVPLVQKLKRYGILVMGIGVQAGVSRVLIEACDSFVFYDDLVPPAPEEADVLASRPDPVQAYALMRRAIEALQRQGRPTAGVIVQAMMGRLDPAFDLARYSATMQEMAQNAERAGYVRITGNAGTDVMLSIDPSSTTPVAQSPDTAPREYDYSSLAAAVASYRTILQERRIPLLPWAARNRSIQHVWQEFESRGSLGMSFNAMGDELHDVAYSQGPNATQQIRKLLYTLNFGLCFSAYQNPRSGGHQIMIPDDLHEPLYPAVSAQEAIGRLHHRYLEILANDGATLHPAAVFELLYGSDVTEEAEMADRKAELEAMCEAIQPGGAITQAYRAVSLV